MPAYRAPDFSFLGSHARGSPQCRQYRRCNRCDELNDEFYGFFLCHSWLIFKWLILSLSSRPLLPCHVDQAKRVETSHKCAQRHKRLKPQRFLDYARNDREWAGEREALGLMPQSLNRPRLDRRHPVEEFGCHRPAMNRRRLGCCPSHSPAAVLPMPLHLRTQLS